MYRPHVLIRAEFGQEVVTAVRPNGFGEHLRNIQTIWLHTLRLLQLGNPLLPFTVWDISVLKAETNSMFTGNVLTNPRWSPTTLTWLVSWLFRPFGSGSEQSESVPNEILGSPCWLKSMFRLVFMTGPKYLATEHQSWSTSALRIPSGDRSSQDLCLISSKTSCPAMVLCYIKIPSVLSAEQEYDSFSLDHMSRALEI